VLTIIHAGLLKVKIQYWPRYTIF